VIRPLTASEASDIGLGEGNQQLSGPQIRKAICRASREPKFIDDENPTNGAVSVYALSAQDELALLNKIMDLSYGAIVPKETAQAEPFPAGSGAIASGVGSDASPGDEPPAP
jgi:hypothetical protein